MIPHCVAIDWGTSNFRLWLLSKLGNPMIVRRSNEGFQQAVSQGFDTTVERYLDQFGIPDNLPIIVCGMAGAKQGWREAPYINTPVSFEQIISNSVSVPHRSRDVRILPGIAQRNLLDPDVMRGEETQLLGAVEHLPKDGLVCIPGTHSKWIKLSNGQLEQFSTFITGEMFGLLANHSTLKLPQGVPMEIIPSSHAFHRAFNETIDNPGEFTHRLFKTRSSNLLGYSSPNSDAAIISGCTLGLEFSGAQSKYGPIKNVTLVSTGQLGKLYATALQSRGVKLHQCDCEEAVIGGLFKAATAIWPI